MRDLEESAWLLRSRVNPLAISGALELADGRISFVLDADSADAKLDWLEERLGFDGLRDRLETGERVTVFNHPLADCQISWPLTGGGSQMVVEAPDRRWIVSHDEPSVARFTQLIGARRRASDWKRALAEAGA